MVPVIPRSGTYKLVARYGIVNHRGNYRLHAMVMQSTVSYSITFTLEGSTACVQNYCYKYKEADIIGIANNSLPLSESQPVTIVLQPEGTGGTDGRNVLLVRTLLSKPKYSLTYCYHNRTT